MRNLRYGLQEKSAHRFNTLADILSKIARKVSKNRKFKLNQQALINMILLCKSKKVTPVLITTPFTVYYNQYVSDQFLYDFYTTINEIAVTQGVSYYDYSHDKRFETNLQYFGDADHLNPEGAIYFTNLLMEEVPELSAYLASH